MVILAGEGNHATFYICSDLLFGFLVLLSCDQDRSTKKSSKEFELVRNFDPYYVGKELG